MPASATTAPAPTPAPAPPTGFGKIGAFGARLTRALSRDGASATSANGTASGRTSSDTAVSVNLPGVGFGLGFGRGTPTTGDSTSQSVSPARGRDLYSTGRGGAGNIHRSQSRDHQDQPTSPPPAGREASLSRDAPPVTHVGRGGAGNIRDPSRPREQGIDPTEIIHEHEVIEQYDGSPHRFSTGRGGAGNIKTTPDRSLSRERASPAAAAAMERSLSRGRALHSTGRGGAGNITSNTLPEEDLEAVDELERVAHSPHRPGEVHSTGRGGLANVTAVSSPPVEHYVHEGAAVDGEGGMVSVGRGGAGNIHERRSLSRGPGPGPATGSGGRSESRGRGAGEGPGPGAEHHHGAIGKLMDRVRGVSGHHDHGQQYEVQRGREEHKASSSFDSVPVDNLPSAIASAK